VGGAPFTPLWLPVQPPRSARTPSEACCVPRRSHWARPLPSVARLSYSATERPARREPGRPGRSAGNQVGPRTERASSGSSADAPHAAQRGAALPRGPGPDLDGLPRRSRVPFRRGSTRPVRMGRRSPLRGRSGRALGLIRTPDRSPHRLARCPVPQLRPSAPGLPPTYWPRPERSAPSRAASAWRRGEAGSPWGARVLASRTGCLCLGRRKIYVGRSRHSAATWLWFFL
jgi:hypothetical protein